MNIDKYKKSLIPLDDWLTFRLVYILNLFVLCRLNTEVYCFFLETTGAPGTTGKSTYLFKYLHFIYGMR